MAAVSLSDAWNEPPDPDTDPFRPTVPVSARKVHIEGEEPTDADASGADGAFVETVATQDISAIVDEIRLLRSEQSRRCSVYLAICGALFAMLFVYIDRLQTQIRTLAHFTRHQPSRMTGSDLTGHGTPFRVSGSAW